MNRESTGIATQMEWYDTPHNIKKCHSESRLNYIKNFKSLGIAE